MNFQDLPDHIQQTLMEKNSGLRWTNGGGIRKGEKGTILIPDPDGWMIRKDLEILLKNPNFVGVTIWKVGQRAETLVYIFKE